jgi:ATP/ADP translocase
VNVEHVVRSSKTDLIDPTLSRIENRLLIFVLIITAILFGLLGYVFWRVRGIVSTGSETVENIMNTVKSLEKVLEKVNKAE